jgi:cysteine desulfuration protein SufE
MAAAMTTPTIDAALAELIEEFDVLGDWEERYRYVIDLGRELAPLADAERTDVNKVPGCASQVWLVTKSEGDGRLVFRGDSDAHIVRGLIAVLLRLFSGRKPEDIAAFDAEGAFKQLGFAGALSQQRSNGLASMVERIRRDARAAA